MPRLDLVPDRSAAGAAVLERDGTIVGPFGQGLALLFSERFRFIAGHDRRRVAGRFEPHPLGSAWVTARKCIPWMHHPFVPHAILERDGDECDWWMVMGGFGPSHDWGDGTEANFPQYGLRKAAKDRRGALWEDGIALELALVERRGERTWRRRLSELSWRIRHRPGLVELVPVEPGPIARVELAAPIDQRCGRVRLHLDRRWPGRGPDTAAIEARGRFLSRRLTVAPSEHRGAIDVLDAPFGFQRFEEHSLVPRALPQGLAWDVPSAELSLFFVASAPAAAACAPVDPLEREFATASGQLRRAPAACFDATLVVALDPATERIDFAFGVDDARDSTRSAATALAAPIDATARDLEGEDGALALRLESGDRRLDALLRWSRHVAHALVAPNGVIMTGALGYSAKCHVGQDVPFVLPLFLLDPHPRLQRAAQRTLAFVVDSPSARDGVGILDHPCEGQDFAFLPMRPRTARIFREAGAAGLFRWVLALERFLALGAERELVARALALLAGKVERHYLPFAPERPAWSAGEETQEPAYSLTTGFDGLAALVRLCEVLDPSRAKRLREPVAQARSAIRAHVERPVDGGGLRLAAPLTRGGVTLEPGWIVQRWVLERDPPWFGFDLPLVGAHALVHEVLSAEHEAALVRLLADPRGSYRVPGAGLAKSPGGEKGVWFWHGALAAKGLARAGAIDAAHELFVAMAGGIADGNGLGVPGEETNGGDYAMAIGALAGLALVESLLGLEVRGERVTVRPVLPSALERFAVAGLTIGGRSWRIDWSRRADGPLRAPAPVELPRDGEPRLTLELGGPLP